MKDSLWFRLLDGAMCPPRHTSLTALDVLRNLKYLNFICSDFKALGETIANCRNPEAIPPYVWYMAEKGVPHFRDELHTAMLRAPHRVLPGYTAVLIDVSHPMQVDMPPSGGINAIEVAASWAVALQGNKRVFTASGVLQEVKASPGLGGIDRILISQQSTSCHITEAATHLCNYDKFDRVVVFTNKILPKIESPPCFIHNVTQPGFDLFDLDKDERNFCALNSLKRGATRH